MPSVPHWTAWVDNGADAVRVTEALQGLAGGQITAVRYVDLDDDSPVAYWHKGKHDELGYGIELDLDDGTTWSVIWEQSVLYEGLGIRMGPLMPDQVKSGSLWDVTRYWRRRGPRQITEVETYWWPHQPTTPTACTDHRGLSLYGLTLHDHARGRVTAIALDASLDVFVYFSLEQARRDNYFGNALVVFGPCVGGSPARSSRGQVLQRAPVPATPSGLPTLGPSAVYPFQARRD